MIKINLDSVRKFRNQNEWRTVPRASALGFEVVGDGQTIPRLCARLVEQGYDGNVEVWRGHMLVFSAAPIHKWAQGKALTGEQPEHLKKVTE